MFKYYTTFTLNIIELDVDRYFFQYARTIPKKQKLLC